MVLDENEIIRNVSELKKCAEITYLIDILKTRLVENRDFLEDPLNSEATSNLVRGRILEIRDLIELFE